MTYSLRASISDVRAHHAAAWARVRENVRSCRIAETFTCTSIRPSTALRNRSAFLGGNIARCASMSARINTSSGDGAGSSGSISSCNIRDTSAASPATMEPIGCNGRQAAIAKRSRVKRHRDAGHTLQAVYKHYEFPPVLGRNATVAHRTTLRASVEPPGAA